MRFGLSAAMTNAAIASRVPAAMDDQAKARNRPAATMPRPADGLPEDLREHVRLMCDLIAIAFQTDRTRVASLILANDLTPDIAFGTAHGVRWTDKETIYREADVITLHLPLTTATRRLVTENEILTPRPLRQA